jgi:hypothetical protein
LIWNKPKLVSYRRDFRNFLSDVGFNLHRNVYTKTPFKSYHDDYPDYIEQIKDSTTAYIRREFEEKAWSNVRFLMVVCALAVILIPFAMARAISLDQLILVYHGLILPMAIFSAIYQLYLFKTRRP